MNGTLLTTIVPNTLHCSVTLSPQQIDDFHLDLLIIKVFSDIESDVRESVLTIEIEDITEGTSCARAVYERREGETLTGAVFCRQRPLCAISSEPSLATWTTVAQIDTRQLSFARQGKRSLSFKLTLAQKDGSELAIGRCLTDYDNVGLGYLDWQENRELIQLQAVQLACALMAQNSSPLCPGQYGLLRGWLLTGINLSEVSPKGKRVFEKSFQKLLKQCHNTELNWILALGREMEPKSTISQRYEIVEFCLHLIGLSKPLSDTVLVTLQKIALIWKIDADQFSMLVEKILSVEKLQDVNPTVLLGMTEEMSTGQVLSQLNRAYAKWNARVTHSDKSIQHQAENMLSWIAQTRGQYKGN